MNWGRLAAAVLLGTALLAGEPAAAADTVSRVVLDDDFSGARGDAPGTGTWTVDGGAERAWQDGSGRLVLGSPMRTAKTFRQAYGRAEARVWMNRADEAWRALGVLDASGRTPAGEVEILDSSPVGGDFHTYAIDWTPTTITWSIDGRAVQRFTPAEKVPYAVVLGLGSGDRRSSGMLVDRVTVSVRVKVVPWRAFTGYRADQHVEYDEEVYRVREPHTSLPGWQPTLVPALFTRI